MAYNILSQVAHEIKHCPTGTFSIQLDKSTDVAHLAQLNIYIRYVHNSDKNWIFVSQTFGNLQLLQCDIQYVTKIALLRRKE
jgi:hypothetical protein